MFNHAKSFLSIALTANVLLAVAAPAFAGGPATFADAQAQAADKGQLLLIDFFAEWCGPCKVFAADSTIDDAIKASLGEVVLFTIDAEKGEGIELAKTYGVQSYPNFVLVNSDGEVVHRWVGYDGSEHWNDALAVGTADPTTIAEKESRFAAHPNSADAELLASYARGASDYAGAAGYYEKAASMEGAKSDYAYEIFECTAYGARSGAFTFAQVEGAANAVLTSDSASVENLGYTYKLMSKISQMAGQTDFDTTPYLKAAYAAAEAHPEETPEWMHAPLAVEYAMHVENDSDKAVELKFASMPEGWQDDAKALNEYAWWAFENGVDFERAEMLARKGVELADAGAEKAMILDTAAELCNALGNCDDAVSLMEEAVAQDPGNKYYGEQLERFQKIVAEAG